MGVKGLLKSIKSIENPTHLSQFSGCTLAIDGYAWLHRGAFACSRQLVLGLPTTQHLDFIMRRIQLLLDNNIKPYFVFDGDHLPMKQNEEDRRSENRRLAKEKSISLWHQGNRSQALDNFAKCVDISPEMAANLIHIFKQYSIQYVVAPYEADSQMVWLESMGIVQGIIAEDSDLLVFGAQCLLTKLDSTGNLIEIQRKWFDNVTEMNLKGITTGQLRCMAILAGCDYSDGIANIGIIKASKLVRRFPSIPRLLRALRLDSSLSVPQEFDTVMRRADLTFQYQRVWCTKTKRLVHLNEPTETIDEPGFDEFVGREIARGIAAAIAIGDVDPITKLAFDKTRFVTPTLRIAKPAKTIQSFFTPKPRPLAPHCNTTPLRRVHSASASSSHLRQRQQQRTVSTSDSVPSRTRKLFAEELDDDDSPKVESRFFKRTKLSNDDNKENIRPPETPVRNGSSTADEIIIDSSPPEKEKQPVINKPKLTKYVKSTSLAFERGALDKFFFSPRTN